METEHLVISNEEGEKTDSGYSESKLALKTEKNSLGAIKNVFVNNKKKIITLYKSKK
jgi:hypothetical protein